MKYCAIIPSIKRAAVLHDTVLSVLRQKLLPTQIILSVTADDDVLTETRMLPHCNVVVGRPGLTLQLNTAVEIAPRDVDMITILDDDVELANDYCERALAIMKSRSELVLLDGHVVKNGNVTRTEAIKILNSISDRRDVFHIVKQSYGCNMNVRRTLFDQIRFDTRLTGPALMHDLEFCRRADKIGIVGFAEACKLVHLMIQQSRPAGLRYGYSQIANPVYFYRKGLMDTGELFYWHLLRPIAANLVGAALDLFRPGEVDRKGRLRGNLIAAKRIALKDCRPEYVTELH